MKLYLFSILFLSFFFSYSQEFIITGKIVTENNAPIDFLEVFLLSQDSTTIIKSNLTDNKGYFSLEVPAGNYLLQAKQEEDILYTKNIQLTQNTELGSIQVKAVKDLGAVVVDGKRKLIERKVDRLVFNVENSMFTGAGDATDILKVTPGIIIQNEQISLIGKNSLKVMVNDKILILSGNDLMNYLKTIQSEDIKNVEVITNPPAKYDVEGQSGLINIRLKRAKQDYWSASLRSSYNQGFYGWGNIGGNFNYSKNKFTIGLNTNYSNGKNRGIEESTIYYPQQTWNETDIGKYYINSLGTKLKTDYQVSDKWNVGIQYGLNYNIPYSNSYDKANIYNVTTYLLDSLLVTKNKNESIQRLNSLNAYSTLVIDSLGKKLTINFDYFDYNKNSDFNFYTNTHDSNQVIQPNRYYSASNKTNFNVDNYSGQVDMEHPLKFIDLQYGAKISYTKTNSGI